MDSLSNSQERLYKIEDAQPEDVEAMRALVREAWLEIYPNEEYGITREDIEAIDWQEGNDKRRTEINEDPNIHTWVLKDGGGELAGFAKATQAKGNEANDISEINAIYLRPGEKGQGWGQALLERVLAWLPADKPTKIHVVRYNFRAINFYKKFGFSETERVVDYGGTQLRSGKEIPRIEMIKK